jgi:hypothetical protein
LRIADTVERGAGATSEGVEGEDATIAAAAEDAEATVDLDATCLRRNTLPHVRSKKIPANLPRRKGTFR